MPVCQGHGSVGVPPGSCHRYRHLAHCEKELIAFFLGFLGRVSWWLSPTWTKRGVSSPPSTSTTRSNSQKSTNSPAAAAVANLLGMVGMVPLRGANCGSVTAGPRGRAVVRGGATVGNGAMVVWDAGKVAA